MSFPSTAERHDVIVVGAGQTGLAAGYHLKRRGLDFTILEASERIGDVWRDRYDSLRLYSPAADDSLPGMPFPKIDGRFPTGRQMADYLEAYVDRLALPVRTAVSVTGLAAAPGGGFTVEAGGARYESGQVIVASGAFQRPWVPDFAAELDPAIAQVHAADYRNPAQLPDGPVLVVGVGHSGSDIAFELAATRQTYLSGRIHGQLPFSIDSRRGRIGWPVMKFVARNVLTLRTPIGRKMARAVRMGGGPLLRHRRADLLAAGVTWSEARVAGAEGGRPTLADGQVLDVASVVWCTGYRPDYGWIRLPILDSDGWPELRRGEAIAAPGLHFVGVPFLTGFTSMLVLGAGRDADMVVRQVAARAAQSRLQVALAG